MQNRDSIVYTDKDGLSREVDVRFVEQSLIIETEGLEVAWPYGHIELGAGYNLFSFALKLKDSQETLFVPKENAIFPQVMMRFSHLMAPSSPSRSSLERFLDAIPRDTFYFFAAVLVLLILFFILNYLHPDMLSGIIDRITKTST